MTKKKSSAKATVTPLMKQYNQIKAKYPDAMLLFRVGDFYENNFLAAVHFDGNRAGVAFIDISTGEFLVAEGGFEYIDKLIQSFAPKEILYQKGKQKIYHEHFSDKFYTYNLEDWVFTLDFAQENLEKHFEVKSLKGFTKRRSNNAD